MVGGPNTPAATPRPNFGKRYTLYLIRHADDHNLWWGYNTWTKINYAAVYEDTTFSKPSNGMWVKFESPEVF